MNKAELKFRWTMFRIKYFFWLTQPIAVASCKRFGHRWWCAKVVPTDPQEWFYMCKRCADMSGKVLEPCGRCTNGCYK